MSTLEIGQSVSFTHKGSRCLTGIVLDIGERFVYVQITSYSHKIDANKIGKKYAVLKGDLQ